MRERTHSALLGVAGTIAVLATVMLAPGAAHAADERTFTEFPGPFSIEVDFGAEWVVPIRVSADGDSRQVSPSDGTVDVYISGQPGVYAPGLPIAADGTAYFAQPTSAPVLGDGTFSVTAIFVPAAGSGLATSQTTAPATLTISPLEVSAASALDVGTDGRLAFDLSLAGEFVDVNGRAPTGTWAVTLRRGDTEVFAAEVAQPAGERVTVPVDAELQPGRDYTGTAVFTPSDELAPGLQLTQPEDTAYRTPEDTVQEQLATVVMVPIWAAAAAAIVVIGALCLLLIGIALRRRRSAAPQPAA